MNEDLLYLIALTMVPNIGDVHSKTLITHFGSAKKIFEARRPALERIPGIGTVRADAIRTFSNFSRAEQELQFIEKYRISALTQQDISYPQKLLRCPDAPVLLYYRGNTDLNTERIISVIGTRNNTEYGKEITSAIIEDLKGENILVASGLAYGIDSFAHKAALKHGLPTVGILAHGLDKIYPAANKGLAKEMLFKGGLLTDFMSETKPDKPNFPMRNRIVAGICDAVIVVETDIRGGSMITAELGNAYHKDVFAVPGRTSDTKSLGCNYLIMNNKAALITSGKDVLDLMNWSQQAPVKAVQKKLFPDLPPLETSIVQILESREQVHIDELNALCAGTGSSNIAAAILNLELENIIRNLPGKMYRLA
ncbi:MAG: DNA-processing protein DprA [Chitinophagaceae bacterium]|nr:DNA-processing protein DprA [Chitinophagaceae bacterium]MCW5927082.1 DNA-processing protein DprA [Chitinophagaceae bacterium]